MLYSYFVCVPCGTLQTCFMLPRVCTVGRRFSADLWNMTASCHVTGADEKFVLPSLSSLFVRITCSLIVIGRGTSNHPSSLQERPAGCGLQRQCTTQLDFVQSCGPSFRCASSSVESHAFFFLNNVECSFFLRLFLSYH